MKPIEIAIPKSRPTPFITVFGQKIPAGQTGVFLVFLLSVAVAMGSAWFAEFGLGLPPCNLCIPQRQGHILAGAAGLFGLLITQLAARRPVSSAPMLLWGIVAVGFFGLFFSAAVAGYHTGIEQEWWPGPETCTGEGAVGSIAEMQRMLEGSTRLAPCDKIPFSFLGLSLAALNLIWTLMMVAAAAFLLKKGFEAPRENSAQQTPGPATS